jgi:hypothetical protein
MAACNTEATTTDGSSHHSFTTEEIEAIRDLTRDAEQEACDQLELAAPAPEQGIQLLMGTQFAPYSETEVCKFVQVGSEDLNINAQQVRYSDGSHHMLIFSTPYTELPTLNEHGVVVDTAEGKIFPCPEGPSNDWKVTGVVGGSQNPEWDPVPLPAGVATVVPKDSWMIMNLHMLNPTAEGMDVCVKNNFTTIPTEDVEHEAGMLFWYNPFITLTPQATSTATLRCPITQDISLVNGQSHMHARGTHYTATLYDAEGAFVQKLFESSDWETPVPEDYEPALQIPAGSSIEYTCEYTNSQDRTVNQGLKTTDEMCMFIGQYYPRDAMLDNCGPAAGFVTLGDPIYHGDKAGPETLQCWMEAEAVPGTFTNAQQDCITSSCAASEVWDYLICAGDNTDTCADSCQVRSNMDLYTADCMGACQNDMQAAQTSCSSQELLESHSAICTTETPMTTYQAHCDAEVDANSATCLSGACATDCVDPEADACTTCQSTCTTQLKNSCVEKSITDCVTALVTECVTEAATTCIQPCVVNTVTKCATECINTVLCADTYDTVLGATCE